MDGPGNVLANAGPCFVRSVGRQPVIGSMRFDAADIQNLINSGRLRDVIQTRLAEGEKARNPAWLLPVLRCI